jgi:hypothetical protein
LKLAIKIAIFAAAGYGVYYLVSALKSGGANPDMGGADFGINGAFSQDTWS